MAVVVTPVVLRASGDGDEERVVARQPAHRQVAVLFAGLVSRCREVLVVRGADARAGVEMVLWLEDAANPGRIDPGEIALVRHSRLLRIITLHKQDGEVDGPSLARSDITAPGFARAWRDRPEVTRRVLATGVSDLTVTPVARADDGRTMFRISLTWAEDSVDGPDEACVLVDAVGGPAPLNTE